MGKGLSVLKRFILQEAYKKGIISNADILIKQYGFNQVSYGKIKFNRQKIGMKKYLSASTAVSNSLTRIRNRGLMNRKSCPPWGYVLTKEGIQAVKKNKVVES